MNREELISSFLEFFKSKKHKIIPSASLVPENDPTVLFTTAGMHPLVPYLLGQKHPLGKKLASVQKCIRTGDIEEVGDTTHHTFFEMLGNWSLNDYWKKESIEYSFEFLTKVLKLPLEKLAVSVFAGDNNAPRDTESESIWRSQGIPKERIAFLPKENNWWGPAGQVGPCGPDTEIFYWTGKGIAPKKFNTEDKNWVEIWNNVFMEYEKKSDGKYQKASQQNVDTGMGVERTLAIMNGESDNYRTSCFMPLIEKIELETGKKYEDFHREMRIIADHIKAATMIISDGIVPGNASQGYVVRRLIRRAVRYAKQLDFNSISDLSKETIGIYQKTYPNMKSKSSAIVEEIKKEQEKFMQTLSHGEKILRSKIEELLKNDTTELDGKTSFLLYQSYGFPLELIREMCHEHKISLDDKEFNLEYERHQQLSKTSSAGMFKSGLADNSEQTTRLHTATHLLNEALRQVLGPEVKQRGSNITPERLRFDFSFPRKLTPEEINKVEKIVNDKIESGLKVQRTEAKLEEAIKEGAQGEFGHKYPPKVSVYTILDKSKKGWFSKEICTGPHVKDTKEIGKFKITKEESVSAGIRRIKAIVG